MDGWVFFVLYTIWALISGYKMVNGRYAWLERKEPANRICKGLVILAAGYAIGGFYLMWMVIRLALRVTDGFR